MTHCFTVPDDAGDRSVERYIADRLGVDFLAVREWAKAGRVTVDGQPAKPTRYVRPGQQIVVAPPPPKAHEAQPEPLDLPIRHLDADLVVVAKPAGMPTHPGPGWWRGTCVNALLHAVPDWPGVGGVAGPGIVHRLDRDTTGLLIFAASDRAHQVLLDAARERRLERTYLAWVEGRLEGEGVVDAPLGRSDTDPQRVVVRPDGKPARTHWKALSSSVERSLLELRLETGRNHQIRVHMKHLGHPVLGDPVYGSGGPFMALHSWKLAFEHPVTGEALSFTEPAPSEWEALGPLGRGDQG